MTALAKYEKEKSWTKTRCYSKLPDFFDILKFNKDDREMSSIDSIFKPITW